MTAPHPHMHTHTLIVGGTGMLRAASVRLAAQTRRLTSVAHTRRSLAALDAALPEGHGVHDMLALDWLEPDVFLGAIVEHIEDTEPPELVLAWIHDERLAIRLAETLGCWPIAYFHVIGSAAVDPGRVAASSLAEAQFPTTVDYHQVILGAGGNGTRWLTDREICDGVLEAIRAGERRFVVGTLDRA